MMDAIVVAVDADDAMDSLSRRRDAFAVVVAVLGRREHELESTTVALGCPLRVLETAQRPLAVMVHHQHQVLPSQ